jgi:hypothetical protein
MNHEARRRAADPGSHASPALYRDAYRWVRHKARAGQTVYYFGPRELFAYCLWNERFTNRVAFADPGGEAAFLSLARRQPGAWLFLPPGSREAGWFQAYRAEFVILYEKNGIRIAHGRPAAPRP